MPVLRYWDVSSNQYLPLTGLGGPAGPTGPTGPAGPRTPLSSTVIGPLTAGTPVTVTHNLNTYNPIVQIWDNGTNQLVEAQVLVTGVNTITVTSAVTMPNNVTVVATGGAGGAANYPSLSYYQTLPAPTVASSPYTIAHNLNTITPHVQIWDTVTGFQVQAQTRMVDANHVQLSVTANMPNSVNVVVLGVGAAPVPMNPGDYSTKAYVDARTANLPAPVTSGTGIQSFTDALGDIWVAKVGVNSGAWKRATNALYAKVWRSAAYSVASAGAWTGMPYDTVMQDNYGCFQSLGSTSVAFLCPVAGRYFVSGRFSTTYTAAVRTIIDIWKNGAELMRGNDLSINSNPLGVVVSDVITAVANDTLQIYYWSNGVSALEVGQGGLANWMTVQLMGY